MHPQTLRKYERLGLVRRRARGSMRLYSHDEIERLRFIKRLVDDAGVNLRRAAVAVGARRCSAFALMQPARCSGRDRRAVREMDQLAALLGLDARLAWTSRTTTPRSASPRPPPRRRSSRRSASSRASTTPTSTRATRAPRRSSRKLNEANEVLSDPAKRKKYDELGANWRAYENAPPHGGGQPVRPASRRRLPHHVAGRHGRTCSAATAPFSDFFTTFFGGMGGQEPQAGGRGGRGRAAQPQGTGRRASLRAGPRRRVARQRAATAAAARRPRAHRWKCAFPPASPTARACAWPAKAAAAPAAARAATCTCACS